MAQRTPTYPTVDEIQRSWAANVKATREAIGLTLTDVAEVLEIRHSTISRWENWRSTIPDSEKVRLAGLYGKRIEDLFPWPAIRPPMPKRKPVRRAA